MLIDVQPVIESACTRVVLDVGRGARQPVHVPAASLAGSQLADRFCFWRGRSGRRYAFSVYRMGADPEALPRYSDAVVLAVRRADDGTRTIVEMGDSGPFPEISPVIAAGLRAGRLVDELHVHLLADGRAGRRATLDDLAGALRRA